MANDPTNTLAHPSGSKALLSSQALADADQIGAAQAKSQNPPAPVERTPTRAETDAKRDRIMQEYADELSRRERSARDQIKAAFREMQAEDARKEYQAGHLERVKPSFIKSPGEMFSPDEAGLPSVELPKSKRGSAESAINDEMAAELAALALTKKKAAEEAQAQKIRELQGAPERIVAEATGTEKL